MHSNETVFTNGCFDILHPGHIAMLQYAAAHGTELIVAIDSDTRIRKSKGLSRPIYKLEDRRTMLEALSCVTRVHSFNSDQELEDLVRSYNPRVMVVGKEYEDKTVIGSKYAQILKFFERIDGYSTTKTIEGITSR